MTNFYITPDNGARNNAISHIANIRDDKSFQVTIKDKIDNKTAQQRNYFHQLLGIISNYSGDTIDDLKTRLCFTLGLTKEVTLKGGQVITQRISTEQLNKKGYSELIDAAQEACQILELNYPLPKFYGE